MIKVRVGDFRIERGEKEAILNVLNSGRISEGPEVRRFEDGWANYIGTKYCSAVNSGTSALIAGLNALKYLGYASDGNSIITTPLTYIATSNAIMLSNLNPEYVDIDPDTFGITAENVKIYFEENPDNNIKGILPVHLMGFPVDMNNINKIAKEKGIVTAEDSAQAHGSIYEGKKCGSMSLFSCFSFYIAHNIQAGEMGAINTNDEVVVDFVNKFKANGRVCNCRVCNRAKGYCPQLTKGQIDLDPRFTHDMIGYNFKTMEFQAALGLVQLKKINQIIDKRQENVKAINEGLSEFSDILKLPRYSEDISYLAYPIVINKPELVSREKIMTLLEKEGIETRPLFGCIPTQQPAYKSLEKKYINKIPNAQYIGKNAFYIGCHQYLSDEDIDYIALTFKKIMKKVS